MFSFRTPNLSSKPTPKIGEGVYTFATPNTTSIPYFPFQAPKFGQQIQMTPITANASTNVIQSNKQQLSNQFQPPNYFDTQLEFASLAINSQTYQYQAKSKITDDNQCQLENGKNNAYEIQKYKDKKENEALQKDSEITNLKSELEVIKSENEILKNENNQNLDEIEHIKLSNIDIEEINEIKNRFQSNQANIEKLNDSLEFLEKQLKIMKLYEKYLKHEKEQLKINVKNYKKERDFIQHHYEEEIKKLSSEIKNQKSKFEQFQDNTRKLEFEKFALQGQIEELTVENESHITEFKAEIENYTLRIDEKDKEQKQYEIKLNEFQDKLKECEKENDKLKEELTLIEEMKTVEMQLNAKIFMLEQEQQMQEAEISQKKQEITIEHEFWVKQSEKTKKLETESFNMTEDLKKLYFEAKELKAKIKDFENIKSNLTSACDTLNNEISKAKQENKKLTKEKEELIKKMQMLEETQASVKNLTDKLSILIENKDHEHERIIQEKDELIIELRRQNDELAEKIKQVQLEKEKVFHNFHELMLTSFKTTPSISTVTPLNSSIGTPVKSSQTSLKVSSQNNSKVSSQTNMKVSSQPSTPLNTKLNYSEALSSVANNEESSMEEIIEDSDEDIIPATQSPFKSTAQFKQTTPVKIAVKENVSPAKTLALSGGTPRKPPVAKASIFTNPTRASKRKLNSDTNYKPSKIVRFSDNKSDKIAEDKAALTRFTRNREKKENSTGIDMSFVKQQLDAQGKNTASAVGKNKERAERDDSWIDDIFNF